MPAPCAMRGQAPAATSSGGRAGSAGAGREGIHRPGRGPAAGDASLSASSFPARHQAPLVLSFEGG